MDTFKQFYTAPPVLRTPSPCPLRGAPQEEVQTILRADGTLPSYETGEFMIPHRMQRFVLISLLGLLAVSCNVPTSFGAAGPTNSPAPSAIPSPTSIPGSNGYITVAQLNLWFHGPGCYGGFEAFDCSGKRNTTLTPLLGTTYDSASAEVIRQQIEWATTYGVDAFSIEWTTPREIPGSIEDILD